MEKPRPAKLKRPRILALVLVQLLTVGVAAGIGLIAVGQGAALSAFFGGLVAWLPNIYFAWRTLRFQGARYTREIVKSFYRAEAGKFGLTVALFALVFVIVPPSNPAFFFGAYVATLFTHWLVPWLVRLPSPN